MQTKKDYIQKAILQAATDEFFEHGYQKASMRKMAERAGTRMSNCYNYFKSKEELAGNWARRFRDGYESRVEQEMVKCGTRP